MLSHPGRAAGLALLLAILALRPDPVAFARGPTPVSASLCKYFDALPGTIYGRCFPASQVRRATAMMPVRPILPWAAVHATLGLRLRQVRLSYFPRVSPRGKVYPFAHLVAITYLFGRLPSALGLPDYGGTSSRYVTVEEDIAPPFDPGPSGLFTVRSQFDVHRYLVVKFACHPLALVLTSNESAAKIRQIEHVIYGSEKCGK